MCKSRVWTPQDRRFVVEIKEALAIPHQGPTGMPRKAVALAIGRTESWYSRVLNPEELDWLPDLVDLRRIATVTGSVEALRVLARWWGEGHELAEQCPFKLLAETVEADDIFTTRLSKDLADGKLDQTEAKNLLPLAAARLRQAESTVDALRKRARRP